MVAGLTYDSYTAEVARLAVVDVDNAGFLATLPSCIDYAELRIYQDLDLLSTVSAQTGFTLTALTRYLQFPIASFITLQEVNVITPSSVTNPELGTRNPCEPVTKEFLDNVWGSVSGAGVPNKFALLNQNTLLFGPWPLAAYSLELVGTVRPTSLSPSNTTTFISTYLPSLFLMASMVFMSGQQRNFGKQSDDPAMAVSYESQYQILMKEALVEETRKKFSAAGWTSMAPNPVASPSRS